MHQSSSAIRTITIALSVFGTFLFIGMLVFSFVISPSNESPRKVDRPFASIPPEDEAIFRTTSIPEDSVNVPIVDGAFLIDKASVSAGQKLVFFTRDENISYQIFMNGSRAITVNGKLAAGMPDELNAFSLNAPGTGAFTRTVVFTIDEPKTSMRGKVLNVTITQ